MGKKLFKNNTSENLTITLLIRQGDDPTTHSLTQNFQLESGNAKEISYRETYLNGLTLNWYDATAKAENAVTKKVSKRGAAPTFDALLNTNSVITINKANSLDISGSN